jgi:FixJ family two-component response regulator
MAISLQPIERDPDKSALIAPVIHIVDDDPAFRTATGNLLRAYGYRVELHESAAKLLEQPPTDHPACIVLDVNMPCCSGLETQDRLAARGSALPIIFVTGHGDIPTTVRAIKAGATDFLTKPVDTARLLETIERALMHSEARERASRAAALRLRLAVLTAREYDVFSFLSRGKPHKQIAHNLGITERTVKFHRRNVMQKLGTLSIAGLAVIADRAGLLTEIAG